MSNKIYNVIIIGGGIDSYTFLSKAITLNPELSFAVISTKINLKLFGQKIFKDIKIDFFEQAPIYGTYNHGLIGVSLSNSLTIFGTKVIIATGTRPVKLPLKSKTIYYKLSDLETRTRVAPIVVTGNNDQTILDAIELAKKHKYIYVCIPTVSPDCSEQVLETLNSCENKKNITILPLCNVVGCKNDKEGNLIEVKLDTYSSVKCNFLIANTKRTPDIPALGTLLSIEQTGHIKVTKNYETLKVPTIFAIGSCSTNTKQINLTNVRYILNVRGY